jgi:hypothetical protein
MGTFNMAAPGWFSQDFIDKRSVNPSRGQPFLVRRSIAPMRKTATTACIRNWPDKSTRNPH